MKLKELKKRVRAGTPIKVEIMTHATHSQYSVRIHDDGEIHILENWRLRPLIFRSLDQARQAVAEAGIQQVVLVQHVAHDEVIGRVATYDTPPVSRIRMRSS